MRMLNIVERIGRRTSAEHRLHRRGRGRVADPNAAIDVVGAKHDAGEFLCKVVLFVGSACRTENADAVGAVDRRNAL
jgi:hypothetical protein